MTLETTIRSILRRSRISILLFSLIQILPAQAKGQDSISGIVVHAKAIFRYTIPNVDIYEINGVSRTLSDKESGTFTITRSEHHPIIFHHSSYVNKLIVKTKELERVKMMPLDLFNERYKILDNIGTIEIKGVISDEAESKIQGAQILMINTPFEVISNEKGEFSFLLTSKLYKDLFDDQSSVVVIKDGYYPTLIELRDSQRNYNIELKALISEDAFSLISSNLKTTTNKINYNREQIECLFSLLNNNSSNDSIGLLSDSTYRIEVEKQIGEISDYIEANNSHILKLESNWNAIKKAQQDSNNAINQLTKKINDLKSAHSELANRVNSFDFDWEFDARFDASASRFYQGYLRKDVIGMLQEFKLVSTSLIPYKPFGFQITYLPFISSDEILNGSFNLKLGLNWWPEKKQVWSVGLGLFQYNLNTDPVNDKLKTGVEAHLTRIIVRDFRNELTWGTGIGVYCDKSYGKSVYFTTPFEFVNPFYKWLNWELLRDINLTIAYSKLFQIDGDKPFETNHDLFEVSLIKNFGKPKEMHVWFY